MQCQVFESRLNQILDRRARPETDAPLVAHAQGCEACRELLAMQELLFDGVELLETPDVSPGFAQRVIARYAPPRRPFSFYPPRWLALTAAVAAMLLVAVVSGQAFLSSQGVKTLRPGPAKLTSSGAAPVPSGAGTTQSGTGVLAVTTPGAVKRSLPPAKIPEPGVGQPAGGATERKSEDYRGLLESWAHRLPEVPRDGLETVEQIPGGLRPIATSFNVAIGLLRRTLPGGKDEPATPPKPQAAFGPIEWPERVS